MMGHLTNPRTDFAEGKHDEPPHFDVRYTVQVGPFVEPLLLDLAEAAELLRRQLKCVCDLAFGLRARIEEWFTGPRAEGR
jgi:hypothetical protein